MKNIPQDWGIEEYLDCATISELRSTQGHA
jgi:hypothetical protein